MVFSNIHSHIVKLEKKKHFSSNVTSDFQNSGNDADIYMHFKTSTSNVAYCDLLKYCLSMTEANIINGVVL